MQSSVTPATMAKSLKNCRSTISIFGAINAAFPDAQIVSVRRHPLDSCFAMFRTLFGAAYPFSYDFEELARYYAAYERLMRHWNQVLPGRVIEVEYEKLVAAPALVAKDLAAACGLSWSDDALDLTKNRAASLTASAAQVRQPIYETSSGIWKNYRKRLEPLASGLRARGVELD